MKKLYALLAVVLLSSSLFAQSTWKVDPMHSQLSFITTHMGISDVAGVFKKFDATITSSIPEFSDAVFELSVDVGSIDTDVEMRDNHLKTADFFDVEKYPNMTFKSTSIENAGKDRYKISGNLTLHGITKPVTMDLWYRGTIENPQSKAPTAGFQLTGILLRSDFDLGSKFPSAMLGDEVKIKADGEFIKQ